MSSRFILHRRRKTTRAASAGSLMALGGSVKQTRTAEALGLRERCYVYGGCCSPLGKARRPFVPQGKCPLPIPTHCLN
jgi:hypothetical protein